MGLCCATKPTTMRHCDQMEADSLFVSMCQDSTLLQKNRDDALIKRKAKTRRTYCNVCTLRPRREIMRAVETMSHMM